MGTKLKASPWVAYWPPLLGAVLALSVLSVLFVLLGDPENPQRGSSITIGPKKTVVASKKVFETEPQGREPLFPRSALNDSSRSASKEGEEKSLDPSAGCFPSAKSAPQERSEIRDRIADWRYVGYLQSAEKRIAVVQRMLFPDRTYRVFEGDSIQEVRVEEISRERMVVSYAGDRDEIFLDQTDPFDLSTVAIPPELSDEPDALVDLVFAQTLGRYLPETTHAEFPPKESQGEEDEALQAIAESAGWPGPYYGESTEDFVGRLEDSLSDLDPKKSRLSEETRHRLLGIAVKNGN